MKRTFVIQEHDAIRAGLHWDLRFEAYGDTDEYDSKRPTTNEPRGTGERVLRSFAVPKHRLPEIDEKLLAIPTEDHPWDYRNFSGRIESGYGEGPVELIFCGEVEILVFKETKIEFLYDEKLYNMYYVRPMKKWMITQKYDVMAKIRRKRALKAAQAQS
jgi:bifunctional non-homologous end joining protein LigD